MNFYIADTHFGHSNCIRFDSRPFENVDDMDQVIISNWNNRVRAADDIWIVGDFCYRSSKDPSWYLERLNGHKHLIMGNHDKCTIDCQEARQHLESVENLQYIKDGNVDIVMCQYPLAEWSGMLRGTAHIYGHIHADQGDAFDYMSKLENAYNAGCMLNAYQPVTFQELIENKKIAQMNILTRDENKQS